MVKLNLPPFDHNIVNQNGKPYIFDIIRKKYVYLTPEEWVRQHFIHLLINHFSYPKSLFKIETGLKYNDLMKRSDILVYDREGERFMIIECKSPDQKISRAVFDQAAVYNKTLQASYVAVTNGLQSFCAKIDHLNGIVEHQQDLPAFPAN